MTDGVTGMGKRQMHLLTAAGVAGAKPDTKPYRLADGGGLYLWVPPPGVKSWQFRYGHGGKPQTFTVGKLSKMQGLAWARGEADKARSRVENGDHLTRLKGIKKATKRAAAANTFAVAAAD